MAFFRRNGACVVEAVEHVGRVLSVETREDRVMSDIYAPVTRAKVVLANGAIETVHVRAHFECDSTRNYAEVDATDTAKALADAFTALDNAKRVLTRAEALLVVAQKAVKRGPVVNPQPDNGDTVEVIRKVKSTAKGTVGKVFWRGTCQFSGQFRYGLKDAAGATHWVNAASIKVVLPEAEHAALAARGVEILASNLTSAVADVATAQTDLATAESAYQAALTADQTTVVAQAA